MPRRSSGSVRVFYPTQTREEVVQRLRQQMEALRKVLPIRRVVLFGSYATGRYTVASDIDVLVVYSDPPRDDAYGLVRDTLDVRRLEPHVYAEQEYVAVRRTVDRMIRDGIAIFEEGGIVTVSRDPKGSATHKG